MGSIARKLLSTLLLPSTLLTSSAQQAAPPSRSAVGITRKVAILAPGDKISVIPLHTREAYGTFKARDADGFTFHDIDDKVDVTIKYVEVKKVKDGYGGYNFFSQRHTDRTRNLVVGTLLVGGFMGVLFIALATAKN